MYLVMGPSKPSCSFTHEAPPVMLLTGERLMVYAVLGLILAILAAPLARAALAAAAAPDLPSALAALRDCACAP